MSDPDLPNGYRWANAFETERFLANQRFEHIIVLRSVDSQGRRYSQSEADIAVPIRKGRPNQNYILQVMRDGDMDDPWGTANAWAFAVAECLTVLGADVPEELGFRPSPFVAVESHETYTPDSYEHEVVWEYLGPETGLTMSRIDDVQFAGRCLARYLDWCKAAGRDY